MKWLEGWFGTASGVLGAVWIALVALATPSVQTSGEVCTTTSDGVTSCSTAYGPGAPPVASPGPNIGALILVGVCVLLFIGVVVGTWLDLRGMRRAGRVILLACATLLIFAPFAALGALGVAGVLGSEAALVFTYPFVLLALITGVLASVRRDAPRSPVSQ